MLRRTAADTMALRCTSLIQRRCAAPICPAARAAGPRRARLCAVCYTEGPATPDTKKTKVEFNVPHHVEFGQVRLLKRLSAELLQHIYLQSARLQEICLVGETEGLGKWEVEQCIPMAWTDGDVWTAKADVPAG